MNWRRGLIRLWVLFTIVWLAGAGGVGIVTWSDELSQIGGEIVASMTREPSEADYEALCVKLRAQTAAGGHVDKIPVISRLEVTVVNGVARIVRAPARCLAVFAKERGIDFVPIFLKRVGGDGSEIRELQGVDGTRMPYNDRPVRAPAGADHSGMYGYFAFIFAMPFALLTFGSGIWWVAAGFKAAVPHDSRSHRLKLYMIDPPGVDVANADEEARVMGRPPLRSSRPRIRVLLWWRVSP